MSQESVQFLHFLDDQLKKNGWSDYKLAKIAEFSPSVLSRIRSGTLPKCSVCTKIAKALNVPTEVVFRAANLLPQIDTDTEDIRWFITMYPQLNDDDRQDIRALVESKLNRKHGRV